MQASIWSNPRGQNETAATHTTAMMVSFSFFLFLLSFLLSPFRIYVRNKEMKTYLIAKANSVAAFSAEHD